MGEIPRRLGDTDRLTYLTQMYIFDCCIIRKKTFSCKERKSIHYDAFALFWRFWP